MMTLQQFQKQHNLKDYLKNYNGYIIYSMTYFETSWALLYSKYYTMTINIDDTRSDDLYIENVQQMFVSFFFEWIPQLNYHYIKTEQLKVGNYGSVNKNSLKMSPITANARTSQEVNDLPIISANVNDNIDYDSLYQNTFSNQIIEMFYQAALDLFMSVTSDYVIPTITPIDNGKFKTKQLVSDVSISNAVVPLQPDPNALLATDLYNQDLEELNTSINSKANDSEVVKLTGDQTIVGTKIFQSDATSLGIKQLSSDTVANYIEFLNTSATRAAYIGFGSSTTGHFTINNTRGDITLLPKSGNTVNVSNTRIVNLATPTADTNGANKKYVDDALASKADDDKVVKLTGAQTIEGIKKFNSSPSFEAGASMRNNKLTFLSDGILATDAVNKRQLDAATPVTKIVDVSIPTALKPLVITKPEYTFTGLEKRILYFEKITDSLDIAVGNIVKIKSFSYIGQLINGGSEYVFLQGSDSRKAEIWRSSVGISVAVKTLSQIPTEIYEVIIEYYVPTALKVGE